MRKFLSVLIALFMVATVAGCASVNTKADEAAIAYSGGPIEGTRFDKVIQPGSGLVWLGLADDYFIYPTTQRTYIISKNATEGDRAGADHIGATNKDGIAVQWEVAIYFKLNTAKIKKFHENIGLKYKAYFPKGASEGSDGWNSMLNDVFRQQVEATVQRVSRGHTTDEMAKGADIFGGFAKEISNGLRDQINKVVGDNYFCGPAFNGKVAEDENADCPEFEVSVKGVSLPQATLDQYQAQKNAELNIETNRRNGDANVVNAEKQAEANVAEAEGKRKANDALSNIYKDPTFIAYLNALAAQQCASNKDHCTMIISNDGASGGVNVNVTP